MVSNYILVGWPCVNGSCILYSTRLWDSELLELFSGFHKQNFPGFQIPQAIISQIQESRFRYMGSLFLQIIWNVTDFRCFLFSLQEINAVFTHITNKVFPYRCTCTWHLSVLHLHHLTRCKVFFLAYQQYCGWWVCHFWKKLWRDSA